MQSDERVWEALRDLERRVKSDPDPENASAVLSEVASTLEQILRPGVSRASTEPAVQTIRLVVADDHTALRESIATRLAMENDLEVVATVGDYLSTMDALCEFEPDIVLLDLSMPGGSGVDFIRQVRAAGRDVRVVVLTMYRDRAMLQASIDAGADGFLTKTVSPNEIVDAVRDVAKGSNSVTVSFADDANKEVVEASMRLSERERSVLYLLSRGYTTKEIASELGLQPPTVDTYRQRLSRKLGIRNRPELVRFALDSGLLT